MKLICSVIPLSAANSATAILIDPFLNGNPKCSGSAEQAAVGATHIVLTHGRDDHIGDAAQFAKKTARRSSRVLRSACI